MGLVAVAVVALSGCVAGASDSPTETPAAELSYPQVETVVHVDDWPDEFDKGAVSSDRFHDDPAGWIDGGETLALVIPGSYGISPNCTAVPSTATATDATTIEIRFLPVTDRTELCLLSLSVHRWTAEVPTGVARDREVEIRFVPAGADGPASSAKLPDTVTLPARENTPSAPAAEPTAFAEVLVDHNDGEPWAAATWLFDGQLIGVQSFSSGSGGECMAVPVTASRIDATTLEIAFARGAPPEGADAATFCTDDLRPYRFTATVPAGVSRLDAITVRFVTTDADPFWFDRLDLPETATLPMRD